MGNKTGLVVGSSFGGGSLEMLSGLKEASILSLDGSFGLIVSWENSSVVFVEDIVINIFREDGSGIFVVWRVISLCWT